MKLLKLYKSPEIFKIALIIAIVVVGYIASVFYGQMKNLDSSVELITNSTKTQLELEKILSIITMYESNLRGYYITKDEAYLKDRFLRRGEIDENIKKIKILVANNPSLIEDVDLLNTLVDRRFNLFRETLLMAKSNKADTATFNAKIKQSSEFTMAMKDFVYKTINTEGAKIKAHNLNHQFDLRDSIISAFLLVLLSLLILLLSFNKINVDVIELKKTNDELQFLYLSFNKAEKIAGFGHWKVNTVTGVYTFSDNFYRLFGVEPNAFEPTFDNVAKFIHPDDLDYVIKSHKGSLISHDSTVITYRIILDNGETRYIDSVGSFTQNSKGEVVKTGVSHDLTEVYKKTLKLEENNFELKSINEELESFNNIVSHDLQEPLRKIQMFISRIVDTNNETISEQGKIYLSKIRISANKMQSLLIDLVDYSRAIKGDKEVKQIINLNDVVNQVLEDLSSNIEEEKAVITAGVLPEINGVSFQIEQLLVNLIVNALKYSKDDIPPEISINREDIGPDEVFEGKLILDHDYYKIVIKDNGIGFKQEYAEKIFVLFQRLETDSKYSGTGVGLAICKKIVDSHKGYIKAQSEPNIGTTFSIFLPKVV
ncbi:ATP-binding protein [Flavobacterium hiemivividum]|uniref:histidine kinase n=1 Tax=Flavobacterium hiemivividum TaxID=2541734 RepID=A0A4R5CVM7_9FLAO|nr:ATP-binding protein [Flavobacterium hiemivividum]TDE03510.1 hypothetical protein E0F98_10560 [Flavobacterium hiemivividum]